MRTPVIAGNWKMNKTVAETISLCEEFKEKLKDVQDVHIIICPTFLSLHPAVTALQHSNIGVGGQNMYWEESGAYTGEVSAEMLKEAGADYVIIGHSERRQFFGETNETVNRKVCKALSVGLTPIMCCGETLEQRESGELEKIVGTQLKEGLANISAKDARRVIIAYEPIWAIGTGKTASPEQAQEMHAFIRAQCTQMWDKKTADAIVIQYGGSVKPANVKKLMSQPDIDGALVGGASLKSDSFEAIVRFKE